MDDEAIQWALGSIITAMTAAIGYLARSIQSVSEEAKAEREAIRTRAEREAVRTRAEREAIRTRAHNSNNHTGKVIMQLAVKQRGTEQKLEDVKEGQQEVRESIEKLRELYAESAIELTKLAQSAQK